VIRPTLYVAGPMTGLPEFNYPAFVAAAADLRRAGYAVLCPVDSEKHNPTPGTPQSWEWYMRHALRMVLNADGIATLPDWESSRGARVEVDLAQHLGMDVRPVTAWLREAAA
jgi:hypothetical protein